VCRIIASGRDAYQVPHQSRLDKHKSILGRYIDCFGYNTYWDEVSQLHMTIVAARKGFVCVNLCRHLLLELYGFPIDMNTRRKGYLVSRNLETRKQSVFTLCHDCRILASL
jgi:hypothetical protein